jgi:hypothetical protein
MTRTEQELVAAITLNVPAAEAWALACDQHRYPDWGLNTTAVSTTGRQATLGSVREETNKVVGPIRGKSRWTVTAFDPPHRQEHRADQPPPMARAMAVVFEIAPRGDQCQLTLRWRYAPSRVGRLLQPVFRPALARSQKLSLARFRALCDPDRLVSPAAKDTGG